MAALLDKPERWRKRAEEIRTIADGMRDPEAKRFMLDLAKSYLITMILTGNLMPRSWRHVVIPIVTTLAGT